MFKDLWQNLSYRLGYAHGLRNRKPYRSPWWVDKIVYGVAYLKGLRARDQK